MTTEKHDEVVDETTTASPEQPLAEENMSEENVMPDEAAEAAPDVSPLELLQQAYDRERDAHLRLRAEYENFRKRTIKEKADIIRSGGETAIVNLLPVIDDFERAMDHISRSEDVESLKEGVDLIYNKFIAYLSRSGVKVIDAVGAPLNTDTSEAIAIIPAPAAEQKGVVIDCTEKGYTLNEKVIRHAKVVVGE